MFGRRGCITTRLTPAHPSGPEHAMLLFWAMTFACWGSMGAGDAETARLPVSTTCSSRCVCVGDVPRVKETAKTSVRVWMARAYIMNCVIRQVSVGIVVREVYGWTWMVRVQCRALRAGRGYREVGQRTRILQPLSRLFINSRALFSSVTLYLSDGKGTQATTASGTT